MPRGVCDSYETFVAVKSTNPLFLFVFVWAISDLRERVGEVAGGGAYLQEAGGGTGELTMPVDSNCSRVKSMHDTCIRGSVVSLWKA